MRLLLPLLGCLLAQGLRLDVLRVPSQVQVGDAARLECAFDAGQDQLYSVKWFKDDVEFFRYLPHDSPANQFFETQDVQVDMSRSSNGTVWLLGARPSAQGTYRCEVSADAPSFRSISAEKFMAVTRPRHERPSVASRGIQGLSSLLTQLLLVWVLLQ